MLRTGIGVRRLGILRLPRLQRETRTLHGIDDTSTSHIDDHDMRDASVGKPVIPEPVLGAIRHVRLDLRVLAFLASLGLSLLAREIGPHPRDERDTLAVGKPAQSRDAVRERGQPLRLAPIRRDEVDLRFRIVLALGKLTLAILA